MPKTKEQKNKVVEDLVEKFKRMKSAVFVNFAGLKMKETQKLREKSWQEGIDYEVVKKTLLGVALKNSGLKEIDAKTLEGNIGVAFGYNEEIDAPKFAAGFSKQNESFKILGGILEKKLVDGASVKMLANLPSRLELLAKLVGTMAAPMSGFVNVLQGNLRSLVQVLNSIKNSKS